MKAVSLTQPWALLVVAGIKRFETRSWKTIHRGPLAVHAAKGYPRFAREFAFKVFFNSMHTSKGMDKSHPLLMKGFMEALVAAHEIARGCVVGTVKVVDCVRTETVRDDLSDAEKMLGDYADGRWAWKLEDPKAFDRPIFCRGAQGLWEWRG